MQQDIHDRTKAELLRAATWERQRVIEIGCGDGRMSALLASLGCQLTAVDPDESSLVSARAAVPGVRFLQASGDGLPFEAASFDLAVFTLSLHHQDPAAALREAARVVGPGGTILVLEPADGSEIERLCRLFHDESPEQRKAREALRGLPGVLLEETVFQTQWRFDDEDELIHGLFAYFQRDQEAALVSAIRALIGDRARPLLLTDELYLACLRLEDGL